MGDLRYRVTAPGSANSSFSGRTILPHWGLAAPDRWQLAVYLSPSGLVFFSSEDIPVDIMQASG